MNLQNERKICRLCLQKCDHFEIIEEVTRGILDMVLVKLNLDVSDEPVVCGNCAQNLKKSFDFTSCLTTKDYFIPIIKKDADDATLDVTEHLMCCICVNLVSAGCFISLDNQEEEGIFQRVMLEECLPDMMRSTTKNAVICTSCNNSLKNHYNFIMECLKIERNIELYCQFKGISSGKINLDHVRKFMYKGMLCADDSYDNEQDFCIDEKDSIGKVEIANTNFIDITESDIESDCGEDYEESTDSDDSSQMRMVLPQIQIGIEVSTNEMLPVPKSQKNSRGISEYNSGQYLSTIEDKSRINHCNVVDEEISGTTIYKCQSCAFQTECENILTQHMLSHTEKIIMYQCESCSFQTKVKKAFQEHKLLHDSSEIITYPCQYCPYTTRYKGSIKIHIKRCGSNITQPTGKPIMYHCETCSFQTKDKRALQTHKLAHNNTTEVVKYSCQYCSYTTRYKGILQIHIKRCDSNVTRHTQKAIIYQCKICSFQTKYKRDFQMHKSVHDDSSRNSKYSCQYCPFITNFKRIFQIHMEKSCPTVTQRTEKAILYRCKMCSFQTKYIRGFRAHKLVHNASSETRQFSCQFCPYLTKYKWNLKTHNKKCKNATKRHIHTKKANVYQCKICSFQTKYKNSFEMHQLVHKEPSELTMYPCRHCPFTTKYKCNLKQHINICKSSLHQTTSKKIARRHPEEPTSFQSGKRTYKRRRASENIRIKSEDKEKKYSEVKLHQCTSCSFQTKYIEILKIHRLRHKTLKDVKIQKKLNENMALKMKRYTCKFCSFATKYKGHYKRHMLLHKKRLSKESNQAMCTEFRQMRKPKRNKSSKKKSATDERFSKIMFKCTTCPYQSKYEYNLMRHRLTHRNLSKDNGNQKTAIQTQSPSVQNMYD